MAHSKSRQKESGEIRSYLLTGDEGAAQGMVILVIPSHARNGDRIDSGRQAKVCEKGMTLLAKIFGGATQFSARGGVWNDSETGEVLWDKPTFLECFADADKLMKPANLDRIVGFMKQVGRDFEQDAVALVIGDRMHFFSEYKDAPKGRLA